MHLQYNTVNCSMAIETETKCSSYTLVLCEEEKLIVKKYQRDYEEIYNKRPTIADAVSDIIRDYNELKNKK